MHDYMDVLDAGRHKVASHIGAEEFGPIMAGKLVLLNEVDLIFEGMKDVTVQRYRFFGPIECELITRNNLRECSDLVHMEGYLISFELWCAQWCRLLMDTEKTNVRQSKVLLNIVEESERIIDIIALRIRAMSGNGRI